MTARVQLDRWCGLSSISKKVFRSLVRNPSSCSVCMHYQGAMLCPTQFGHGNATALKVPKSADHSGLYTVFGEQSANHQHLLETVRKFICSLYGVAAGESMASATYALYTKRTGGKAVCQNSSTDRR